MKKGLSPQILWIWKDNIIKPFVNKFGNLDGIDKFLAKYNLSKTYTRKTTTTENLNSLTAIFKIAFAIKKFPKKQTPGPGDFTGEFYQTFKEEIPPFVHKCFRK